MIITRTGSRWQSDNMKINSGAKRKEKKMPTLLPSLVI